MKTLEKVEEICNEEMTDLSAGPVSPEELLEDLRNVFQHRSPETVIVIMKKRQDSRYHSSIYIPKEDFDKYLP